jgi:hypothetical protein
MIAALRERPDEFEMRRGWLAHKPSRHYVRFGSDGTVSFEALCDCTTLAIRPEEARELHAAFRTWQQDYWHPLQVNRQFASHFQRRRLRRLLGTVAASWERLRDALAPRQWRSLPATARVRSAKRA